MRPPALCQGCKVGQPSPGGLPWQQGKFCTEADTHAVGWEAWWCCLLRVERQAVEMAFEPQGLICKMGVSSQLMIRVMFKGDIDGEGCWELQRAVPVCCDSLPHQHGSIPRETTLLYSLLYPQHLKTSLTRSS